MYMKWVDRFGLRIGAFPVFAAEGALTMCTSPEKYACRSSRKLGRVRLAAVAFALVLAATAAGAQDAGAPAAAGGPVASAQVTREERSLMGALAQINMAEIEAGQLALEKSRSEQVRGFAQQVVDEHSADLQALRALAQARGVSLPEEESIRSMSQSVALKMLSGRLFDRQYLKRMGISEHQRTLGLLRDALKNTQDPELQALIEKMLPVVQSHLQKARLISVQQD
jgi:putative membrane protein